jgi:phosphoribosylamine-glycine ligase
MNIMSLFEGSWTEAMQSISSGTLAAADVPLREGASLVLYLVSPDYAVRPGPALEFDLDESSIEREGAHVFFSSAVRTGEHSFRTVGTSRALAIATTAPTLEQARVSVVRCADTVPQLEWRADVGAERYLEGLRRLVAPQQAGGPPLLSRAL